MKFSVKSIYPISTSILCATNCRTNWESAAMEVEYLFMGDGSQNHGQFTEGNDDYKYVAISALIAKPQLDQKSGGYRQRNLVPI
ncbi:MAG: hypothetical protein V7K89_17695 [Nostoc sp.]|uniref:hypothetical protein n=1 Tax=Nostoc sp. TaxID=1180 RepID=UPI002FFB82E4